MSIDDYRRTDSGRMAVPSLDGWFGFFAKQGVFVVLFVGLLAFLGYYVFIPMQQQTKAFQDAIIRTNEQHASASTITATAMRGIEDSTRRQEETGRQTLQVLQQLREDTRRGVWNDSRPKGGSGE